MRSAVVSPCAALAVLGMESTAAGGDDGDLEADDCGRHVVASAGCSDCHISLRMGPEGREPDTERSSAGTLCCRHTGASVRTVGCLDRGDDGVADQERGTSIAAAACGLSLSCRREGLPRAGIP